jgi:hypothetical protein
MRVSSSWEGSDLFASSEISKEALVRYLEALASVTGSSSLLQEAAEVCCPIIRNGKRYRGLNALAHKDHTLLRALSCGEFVLSGIRNADLRALLYPRTKIKPTKAEIRRSSAAVTRQFALLRAHGLLKKLPRTHRYQITTKGRRIITALLATCYAASYADTPIRRHPDTMGHCGCGYAALWPSVQNLSLRTRVSLAMPTTSFLPMEMVRFRTWKVRLLSM